MPNNDINMDEHWEQVQTEIASRGFVVYPNYIISSERMAFWPQEESITKFLDLALELDRKVIYTRSSKFTADKALELLLLTATHDLVDYYVDTIREGLRSLGVDATQEAKDYLKTAKFYEGHRELVQADWVYDGIIHTYRRRPPWYGELVDLGARIIDISEELAFR